MGHDMRLFLSFDPRETGSLALRLTDALRAHEFEVRCDTDRTLELSRREIPASAALIALLSPAATGAHDGSLCLEELHLARSGVPPRPIFPVMALPCELPLTIFLLHYIDMLGWEDSPAVFADGVAQLVRAVRERLR